MCSVGLSCAGERHKLSPAALRAIDVEEGIDRILQSYEAKDLATFLVHVDPGAPVYDTWKVHLPQVFRQFSVIQVGVVIDRIWILDDRVDVALHWNGAWKDGEPGTAGAPLTAHGNSKWRFSLAQGGVRLVDLSGDDPFLLEPGKIEGLER